MLAIHNYTCCTENKLVHCCLLVVCSYRFIENWIDSVIVVAKAGGRYTCVLKCLLDREENTVGSLVRSCLLEHKWWRQESLKWHNIRQTNGTTQITNSHQRNAYIKLWSLGWRSGTRRGGECRQFTGVRNFLNINVCLGMIVESGARGGAVCWGTALQVGRPNVRFPTVSLEFFIDIILPAPLCSWGWPSLQQKWIPGILPGVKTAGS
jgi:hypothetical protein